LSKIELQRRESIAILTIDNPSRMTACAPAESRAIDSSAFSIL